jgi:hypothetical protein
MTYPTTIIRKIKRPEGIARWSAYIINKDRYGQWLYSPKGTLFRSQKGAVIGECEVGQGNRDAGLHVMHLIPNKAWWIATWCVDHIAIDICTPPTRIDDEWHYTDLELDPIAFSNGRIIVEDEDEFSDACNAGLIPPKEATEARSATTTMVEHLRHHIEPYGQVGWNMLNQAISLSLPPIRELKHISLEKR